MLPRARVVWPALIGAVAALDWWASLGEANGDTLSEVLRDAFDVDTRRGRLTFTLAVALGATILHEHIVRGALTEQQPTREE